MPLRVQCFRLRLMRYQYSISHVAGKEICTADTLSRAPVSQQNSFKMMSQPYILLVIDRLPATEKRLIEIQKAQEEDSKKHKKKILSANKLDCSVRMAGQRMRSYKNS